MTPTSVRPTCGQLHASLRYVVDEVARYKRIARALGAPDDDSARAFRIAEARPELDNAEVFLIALAEIVDETGA